MLAGSRTLAVEFFGDLLYWQATEPVDWTMNTNRASLNQSVAFDSVNFDYSTGFRVGAAWNRDWDTKLCYTRFYTETENTASGYLTPIFFGGRSMVDLLIDPPYFQNASVQAVIDYNVIDLDFSKSFCPVESLQVRPVLGLRGAWINQTFDVKFEGTGLLGTIHGTSNEHLKNNFWGIGPKIGVENTLNLWSHEKHRVDLTLNFYTAYLLGYWSIHDVATNTLNTISAEFNVPIADRHFGALMFQAMAGVNYKYGNWNVTAGYEINDWLNQCQLFDDGTGPHNNDLIVQGLIARVGYSY
jgi:hypothetical protein